MGAVPDVLGDVRYWLRHHPALTAPLSGRVFFRIPDNQTQFPLIRLSRTGGGAMGNGGDLPALRINISLELWHNADSGYNALRSLVAATETALFNMPAGTLLNPSGTTIALDAMVGNGMDSPDPALGWPRYILDTAWLFQPV